MSESSTANPEVQPKAERGRFTAAYKRRIVAETEQCQQGELGSLLRREGVTYAHPAYRTKYADNLKRELPRIPFVPPSPLSAATHGEGVRGWGYLPRLQQGR